jgi:hypothetical protein
MRQRESLYTVVARGVPRGVPAPLAEAPIGPGHWAYPNRPGTRVYAVPRAEGGYEWASWEEAVRRGWSGRSGRCEYEGPELERRLLVLYYPRGRRAWWELWRPRHSRPLRLGLCASEGQAEAQAERVVPRRQLGFGWELSGVKVRGWDDREYSYHEDCEVGCGCSCAAPDRDHVLIVEFPDRAAALRPDVRFEPEAWMEALTVERAVALSGCPDEGACSPLCLHCSASYEEIEAAWEWLESHRRQVRAFERRARRGAQAVAERALTPAAEEARTW